MRRWAAPCESQTASSPTCNTNGNGDGNGDATATAKSTAASVSGHTAQGNGHDVNNGMDTHRHLWTHTHTNTLFWKHTRTNLGTHTDTCETATWRRNIHLGVHRSARHVRSIHFFPHWVKIEKNKVPVFFWTESKSKQQGSGHFQDKTTGSDHVLRKTTGCCRHNHDLWTRQASTCTTSTTDHGERKYGHHTLVGGACLRSRCTCEETPHLRQHLHAKLWSEWRQLRSRHVAL